MTTEKCKSNILAEIEKLPMRDFAYPDTETCFQNKRSCLLHADETVGSQLLAKFGTELAG